MKVTGTLDMKNPDITKRHNKLAGTLILKDLVYKGEKIWEGGTIYDPDNGKTYSCKTSIDNKSNLRIIGYLGVPLAGRTVLWKRIN